MLKNDLKIFTLNGKDTFLNVTAENFSFDEGKVTFLFGKYDLTKAKGERLIEHIKIWLSIDEASYLSEILLSNKIISLNRLVEKGVIPYKPYFHSGGGVKNGETYARQLYIDLVKDEKSKYFLTLSGIEGPGIKSSKGLFTLDKARKNERKTFKFPLTYEDSVNLGLKLKRAVSMFDYLILNKNLDKYIENLKSI